MHVRATGIEALSSDQVAAWSAIQRAEPTLGSPFFRPEFAQAVCKVRSDVEVAVMEEEGRPLGFFPYQRSPWNIGRPVGCRLSDYHGVIAPSRAIYEPMELVRGCGLKAWHFENLPCEQESFAPYVSRAADSYQIDTPADFDQYFAQRPNGFRLKSEYGQKKRKLEREVGPLRYVACAEDRRIISTLIDWKIAQFHRMNTPNILSYQWVCDLLVLLPDLCSNDFAPMVSVLYAGDTITSIRFDLRAGKLLHGWFATYNIELPRYSPGMLHWFETIKTAQSMGIERVDLGKGEEAYKRRLMTGSAKVAEGSVDLRGSVTAFRRAWWTTREQIRKSPFAHSVRAPAQIAYRFKHWLDSQ